jgi:hypothetical protein
MTRYSCASWQFDRRACASVWRLEHSRSVLRLLSLALPQREEGPDIRYVLQSFEQRDEVQKVVVSRVADPALNRDSIICGETLQISLNPHT